MPNSIVPAADEGLPNLNRRSALAKVGIGVATGVSLASLSSAATAGGPVSPELLRLIEAHRAAHGHMEEAGARCSDADAAYMKLKPADYAPLSPAGQNYYAGRDYETIREKINNAYNRLANDSWIFNYGSLDRQQQYVDLCDVIKDEALAELDSFFAQDEEAKRLSGLDMAQRKASDSSYAEKTALETLCEYPCATPAEELTRLRYLAHVDGIHDRSDALWGLFKNAAKEEA